MSSITVEGSLMPAAGVLKRGERATWADTPRLRDLIAKGHLVLIAEQYGDEDEIPVPLDPPPADPKIGAEPPAKNASTEEWATFLGSQGWAVDEDETRAQLIQRWDEYLSGPSTESTDDQPEA